MCADWFVMNHAWGQASYFASVRNLRLNSDGLHPCCSRCHTPAEYHHDSERKTLDCRLEVDHIIPVNGAPRTFTCYNHQDNLRVLCHKCHLEATKEQRAAGLIGRPK